MIELKKWSDVSHEALEDLYENVDQSRCLVQLMVPLPKEQTEKYINAIQTGIVDDKPFLCFAITLDDKIIGKTELSRYPNNAAEIDIVLKKEYTGKGYGAEAIQQLYTYVQKTSWCNAIYAYVSTENIPAGKLFARAGYALGRPFQADVMVPVDGNYRMETKKGYEFIIDVEKTFM
ncbi:MAG: GNAT family N-acetyltransferase [Solobacterium sp.]|nr:GNAT family N-acetyltransferase [Solobacterium sp.]